MILFYKT